MRTLLSAIWQALLQQPASVAKSAWHASRAAVALQVLPEGSALTISAGSVNLVAAAAWVYVRTCACRCTILLASPMLPS